MARRLKFALLQWLGVTSFWRWLNRYRVTVLFMHGVIAPEDGHGTQPTRWQLDPALLDRYLKVLRRHYEFVSTGEAVDVICGKQPPRKYLAAITIDDGYTSAARGAWPVLEANNVPATVFVTSGQMRSGNPFLWDRLDYAMLHTDKSLQEVRIGDHPVAIDLSDRAAIGRSSKRVIFRSREKFNDESQRIAAMQGLVEQLEDADTLSDLESWCGVMDAGEVAALSNAGATIGSHSQQHVRLAFCSDDEVSHHVKQSKSELESVLGCECSQFCYPEGSVDDRAAEAVRRAGYESAFSTENGLNAVGQDRYRLKRIHLPESASDDELLVVVGGLNRMLAGLKSRLLRS